MIDQRFLKGIVVEESKKTSKIEPGKRERIVYSLIERPITTADVISYRDCGATVVFVTVDGKKHTVSKVASKVEELKVEGAK